MAILSMTVALVLALRVLSRREFLLTISVAFRVVLIATLLVALAVPSVGLVDENYQTGALKGLFVHRNLLAFMALVALATFLVVRRYRSHRASFFDIGLAVVCLAGAQSQTVFISAAATTLLVLMLRWTRRYSGFTRVLLGTASSCAVGLLVYLAIFAFADIASSLGRDSTLTGRTDVWPAVLEQIARTPILGLGWNAPWREGQPETQRMWRAAGFKMYHSHDGYLDMLLQLGVVGLGLMSIVLVVTLIVGIASYVGRGDELAVWSTSCAIVLVMVNLTESPSTNFFGHFVLVSAFLLARQRKPVATVSYRPVFLEGAR
ncbi:O-antigen ligase family protein [Actinomycetospora chlora]|uniref:O-antigen ligase family protein n=1 Tax=Actinomycetospora chlora TaxID=663608 RepID=UPI0031E7AAE8